MIVVDNRDGAGCANGNDCDYSDRAATTSKVEHIKTILNRCEFGDAGRHLVGVVGHYCWPRVVYILEVVVLMDYGMVGIFDAETAKQ